MIVDIIKEQHFNVSVCSRKGLLFKPVMQCRKPVKSQLDTALLNVDYTLTLNYSKLQFWIVGIRLPSILPVSSGPNRTLRPTSGTPVQKLVSLINIRNFPVLFTCGCMIHVHCIRI